MTAPRITVLLADDHVIVREGLRTLLESQDDFEVVAEASTGREAIDLAQTLQPTVILMDIAMPILNGFEATRQIRLLSPRSKVLVLSAHGDDEYVEHLLSVGVSGYLIKQSSGQILLHAIREVAAGRAFFSASIKMRREHRQRVAREHGEKTQGSPPLTPREAEVLQMVAEGAANKQIAAVLGISVKTVEKHRQRLMDKLNIHETAGLTRHAIATGVIEHSVQATTEPPRATDSAARPRVTPHKLVDGESVYSPACAPARGFSHDQIALHPVHGLHETKAHPKGPTYSPAARRTEIQTS